MAEVLSAILGYLLGSINTAILLVRVFFHKDIRSSGSGNAGATNAGRSYGLATGLLTLAGDMGKALIACALGNVLAGSVGVALAGLFCLLGHCWPVFFKFHGGKGVAVCAGTLLYLDWRIFFLIVGIFLVVILLSRWVSLGSIAAVVSYPLVFYLMHRTETTTLVITSLMCLLVVFQHRSNIVRIFQGTESKFSLKKHHE